MNSHQQNIGTPWNIDLDINSVMWRVLFFATSSVSISVIRNAMNINQHDIGDATNTNQRDTSYRRLIRLIHEGTMQINARLPTCFNILCFNFQWFTLVKMCIAAECLPQSSQHVRLQLLRATSNRTRYLVLQWLSCASCVVVWSVPTCVTHFSTCRSTHTLRRAPSDTLLQ